MDLKNIQLSTYNKAYFVGAGGIGMSALARYFKSLGWKVGGYDKTATPLTESLIAEGIDIHFEDLGSEIPTEFKEKETTLVIFTPAIPKNNGELNYFMNTGFHLFKRSQILGIITANSLGLGVAGTHGKTTTSTLLAHILNESHLKCNAFLGGISSNFNSNLVTSKDAQYTVVEADEFDRSFLQLSPFASIITSTDADHLDIYGDASIFLQGFQDYANLIHKEGFLILKKGLKLSSKAPIYTYGVNAKDANFTATNLRFEENKFLFDIAFPKGEWKNIEFGLPGIHNTENALACIALLQQIGLDENEIRLGLKTFKGVKRRFEYQIKSKKLVYIDDYAHHPTEIQALISSVRLLYPNKKITGIFQPHLFSRTRDFFDDFANELSQLDEIILLPIYPAREEPIEGVDSAVLLAKINNTQKHLMQPLEAIEFLKNTQEGVILTIGAGDIDRIVEKLKTVLNDSIKK
ncbi:MAG: UDP-N-acetylmuramate--L-alanine ligase [Flavobacteriia bacterium]|nr:UDP-N-acetylmuramate--L-alanine ligase [Flavobacteriia bacterium]